MKPINEMTNGELVHHVKKDLHPVYRDDINQILADRLEAQSKREAELLEALRALVDEPRASDYEQARQAIAFSEGK